MNGLYFNSESLRQAINATATAIRIDERFEKLRVVFSLLIHSSNSFVNEEFVDDLVESISLKEFEGIDQIIDEVLKEINAEDAEKLSNFIIYWISILFSPHKKNVEFFKYIENLKRDSFEDFKNIMKCYPNRMQDCWFGITKREQDILTVLCKTIDKYFSHLKIAHGSKKILFITSDDIKDLIGICRNRRVTSDCGKPSGEKMLPPQKRVCSAKDVICLDDDLEEDILFSLNAREKIEVPASFPAWMPNGGNTCFISSVLWPLLFLFDHRISQIVRTWSQDTTGSYPARDAFCQIYKEMKAKAAVSARQVKAFRLAMQRAFPKHFESKNDECKQEDARIFLNLMTSEFLELDDFALKAPTFFLNHEYERIEMGDDLQKIQDEKQPIFSTVHVSWKEQNMVALDKLVTDPEQTHVFNKEISESNPVQVKVKQRVVVESKEKAPQTFICSLSRYREDQVTKKNTYVVLNEILKFQVLEETEPDQRVVYDLIAVTVHNGKTIHQGHYYTYFRCQINGRWMWYKYDDLIGTSKLENRAVFDDICENGYLVYYQKKEENPFTSLIKAMNL